MTSPPPASTPLRPAIYQLFVRTFGNTNPTRKFNGTLAENGCGKFGDINDAALTAISGMGFTHVWLTGVLEQASGTAYPDRPADEPDILKGIAGSPYAIRDYFDVCPDYADVPGRRLEEFRELVERCHGHGLKVIIDFVPNHVARTYGSDVRPDSSFGADDDVTKFFDRENHFYYLMPGHPGDGPPLKLPTAHSPGCRGTIPGEMECGRVTGNNAVTWAPSIHDWYETVKLNYGHDFTLGRDTAHLPGPAADPVEVPRTWRTMDEILSYWQGFGVDGFRVDMAHMVPVEFWRWVVERARRRDARVFFCAEAYDGDPAKLTDSDVLGELLAAGFNAVYDHPSYRVLLGVYESGYWLNDLDAMIFGDGNFHRLMRYAENHDEVRLANPLRWGGVGMRVGRPVSAVLFAMSRGPFMLYNGQEVGEPAIGAAGFSGDDGRTSIFDYGSMPEFVPWVNGRRYDGVGLAEDRRSLRRWYGKLVSLMREPAFVSGEFYGLNHANRDHPAFGRLDGEGYSGHWLYAFLRHDPKAGQTFLVVANFHGSEVMGGVTVRIPEDAWHFTGRAAWPEWSFQDRLDGGWSAKAPVQALAYDGLALPDLPPCGVLMLEIGPGPCGSG